MGRMLERPAHHVSSPYGAIAGHVWEINDTALVGHAHAHEHTKQKKVYAFRVRRKPLWL